MAVNQKPTGRAMSLPGGLAVGAAVSLGITLLCAAALAKLIDMEKMPWESVGYGIIVLLFLASFLGAIAAHRAVKRQRLLVCGVSGLLYFGLLLSITALFFGGQYEGVWPTAAVVLCGSICAFLLGLRGGRGGRRRKTQTRHR